jgi:hypothetical protein
MAGVNLALLQDDVLHTIFGFLDGESLIRANCCCKTWNKFLKQPGVLDALSSKFDELPIHIDPLIGDDCSTTGSSVWPFKTIARAEQWMQEFESGKPQRKPKCSKLFRPFLSPDAFDFKEVRFHCQKSHAGCDILQCSVRGRLTCQKQVCNDHGIGWGRWIKNYATNKLFVCFDSDAFVCRMQSCNRVACEKHFTTLFKQCDVCLRSSKYANICSAHSQQCLRYVNDDRKGLGTADYRDDVEEWDGKREICGMMHHMGICCEVLHTLIGVMCCPVYVIDSKLCYYNVYFRLTELFSCYSSHNCGCESYAFSANFDSDDVNFSQNHAALEN